MTNQDILGTFADYSSGAGSYANVLTGVRILLEGGADPNARDGATIYEYARADAWAKILERLLRAGGKPDLYGKAIGRSALMAAISQRRAKNVELLLRYGADPNRRGRTDAFPVWLRPGVSRPSYVTNDVNQVTHPLLPLSVASRLGEEGIVSLLLVRKAKVEAKDTLTGMTALHEAAEADQPGIVRLLLKAGARRTVRDKRGRTPLKSARERKAAKAARSLGG